MSDHTIKHHLCNQCPLRDEVKGLKAENDREEPFGVRWSQVALAS